MSQLDRLRDDGAPSPLPRADLPRGLTGVRELVSSRYGETLTLSDLAAAARMPANTLTRRFHVAYGMSPMRWLWAFRTLLAAELIAARPGWSLTDVAIHCGFGSSAHFSRRFRALLGDAPSRFRAQARAAGRSAADADADALIGRVMARLADLT